MGPSLPQRSLPFLRRAPEPSALLLTAVPLPRVWGTIRGGYPRHEDRDVFVLSLGVCSLGTEPGSAALQGPSVE